MLDLTSLKEFSDVAKLRFLTKRVAPGTDSESSSSSFGSSTTAGSWVFRATVSVGIIGVLSACVVGVEGGPKASMGAHSKNRGTDPN